MKRIKGLKEIANFSGLLSAVVFGRSSAKTIEM
jgi:hypothetical protein